MSATITYEGTLPGSRIQGKVISRNDDGSITVEHPDGGGWTYRVPADSIIVDADAAEEATPRTVLIAISDNQGYAPDQISTHITLADVLESIQEAIEEHGADAKVVLSNGQRYGARYGAFVRAYGNSLEITDADQDEEEGW